MPFGLRGWDVQIVQGSLGPAWSITWSELFALGLGPEGLVTPHSEPTGGTNGCIWKRMGSESGTTKAVDQAMSFGVRLDSSPSGCVGSIRGLGEEEKGRLTVSRRDDQSIALEINMTGKLP